MRYEVYLKPCRGIVLVEADKFTCENEYTVFYARPSPSEKFEEVKRFESSSIARIKESE